ncbi:hypothetical protein EJ110_NYTH38062 [Nymphaea thermarum]|uniref:uncharacterized protein LOC116252623 n=1 Tax=Nymphaea colorata TaxID=210225 RepID=UPI00129ED0F9|nr:uncharacterized protein LOC116252623 [Nymphaea colorata]XP_031482868.1 uncharacterized protein LOC116252623 [Nymphaea colorata]KAF3780927.1 hypothetical protein EJ110_NYTH38062 [Nymphaea thermarum]
MEEYNFAVGQEFPDVKSFRKIIKEAAIAQHFEFRIIKSDLSRFFAKCAKEGCPWRIRAVKLNDSPTFQIRSLEGVHTCGRNANTGHQQASIDWIVARIEERLRDNINYKPKEISEDIHRQYGITIPYKQAWRAKERGMAAIYGSVEEGYSLLPAYCEEIKKTNPGSVAQIFTTGSEHRFHRLFISFYPSIQGFIKGCPPLIGIGDIHLKSKYLGTLLSATSFDGDGALFPLAFGIVDVENDESWMWFLSEIHKLLEMNTSKMPQLTVLSDGRKGIADAVKRKFPTAAHAFCMRHLSENFAKEFKNPRLVNILWKAAYAVTASGFREKMAEIEELSADAGKWIQQVPPSRWTLTYFEGPRFGHLASNVDEFNKWILDARELPIIQVMERIHGKLVSEFHQRRERSMTWMTVLTPSAEKRMVEAFNRASEYQVLRSDEVEFEVISGERSNIVNIGTRSCSCRDWQLYGIPCSHAVAALLSCRKDVYEFTEKCFTTAKYRETYMEEIHPIPAKILWTKPPDGGGTDDDKLSITVRPPKIRRPPGRPEKKRLCLEDFSREKHTVHCSKCNQTGHYKTTCKADKSLMPSNMITSG